MMNPSTQVRSTGSASPASFRRSSRSNCQKPTNRRCSSVRSARSGSFRQVSRTVPPSAPAGGCNVNVSSENS